MLQSGEYLSWSWIGMKLNDLGQCGSQCRGVLLRELTLFQHHRVREQMGGLKIPGGPHSGSESRRQTFDRTSDP